MRDAERAATPGVAFVERAAASRATGETALRVVTPDHLAAVRRRPTDLVHRLRDDAAARRDGRRHRRRRSSTRASSSPAACRCSSAACVGLSFLLLLCAFRSPLIALKAGAMNLLSVGAAYGVIALFAQAASSAG